MAIAAGTTSGIVILSAVSGSGLGMALAYLTPLPLLLIGLAFGLGRCAAAAAIGAVLVTAVGPSALPVYLAVGPLPALLLSWAALRRLRTADGQGEWWPLGRLLVVLSGGAVLVMAAFALAIPHGELTIEAWLKSQAEPMIAEQLPGIAAETRAAVIGVWIAVLPALAGAAWFAMALANGVVAQWAVGRAGHARRPPPAFVGMRLPLGQALAAAAMAMASVMGGDAGYLAGNAAMVLLLPYLVAGVADLHGVLRRKPNGALWLGVFYGVFFALFGWTAMVVTVWGLVRQCIRSRRDTAQDQEDSDGSHSA